MTILQGDIRQLKSQVMLDTNDGGGPMTSAEVVDGASNGIFDDSSQLDRAYGNISLRKLYLAIQTANTDSYLGTHVIIDSIPQDSHVSMTLFTTKNWFDRRSDAQDKVERYLARGPLWSGHLLEMQLEGQRSIQLTLDASDPVPAVGQGMVLVSDEGKSTEYEQYIRVMRIQLDTRKFPVKGVLKERVVCTLMLSDPLRYNFEGMSVEDYFDGNKPKAVCRDTTVADAANYFGCTPLVNAVTAGTSVIQMQSIFAQLVPSAQAETPVADVDASGQSAMLVAGNTAAITVSHIVPVSTTQNWYLGSGILPNSLTVTVLGQTATDSGTVLKTDNGIELGRVDYGIGIISWFAAAGTSPSTTVTANFIPAVAPARPNRTTLLPVTAANRMFNWITTVRPIPSPGSTVVSYISQGKVYWLRDNGSGQLKGADSSFGAGTVNYVTGTISVTTGALPDANTAILIAWAAPLATYARADLPVKPASVIIDLNNNVLPSSVTITWTLLGNTKTALDNGKGLITGDASGTINYKSGIVTLIPNQLPQAGTQFSTAYNYGDATSATPTVDVITSPAADSQGQITFTVPGSGSLRQGSLQISLPLTSTQGNVTLTMVDVPPTSGDVGQIVRDYDRAVMGSVTYSTRQVTIKPVGVKTVEEYHYSPINWAAGSA